MAVQAPARERHPEAVDGHAQGACEPPRGGVTPELACRGDRHVLVTRCLRSPSDGASHLSSRRGERHEQGYGPSGGERGGRAVGEQGGTHEGELQERLYDLEGDGRRAQVAEAPGHAQQGQGHSPHRHERCEDPDHAGVLAPMGVVDEHLRQGIGQHQQQRGEQHRHCDDGNEPHAHQPGEGPSLDPGAAAEMAGVVDEGGLGAELRDGGEDRVQPDRAEQHACRVGAAVMGDEHDRAETGDEPRQGRAPAEQAVAPDSAFSHGPAPGERALRGRSGSGRSPRARGPV